jgi:hypothetical protein
MGRFLTRHFAVALGIAAVAVAGAPGVVAAEVVISINKAKQTMSVLIDGKERYNWVVSTGVGGGPHNGTYRPGRMERKWASRKYGMAPMPYSIFFDGNYAIHGTVKIAQLGRRASKGCVRLHPRDAAVLFALVQRERAGTSIVVSSTSHVAARPPQVAPSPPPRAAAPQVAPSPKPAMAMPEAPKPERSVAVPAVVARPGAPVIEVAGPAAPMLAPDAVARPAEPAPTVPRAEPEPAVTGAIAEPVTEEFLE